MTAVVLVPLAATLAVLRSHGFAAALVAVGIPTLLLFPSYYLLDVPGIPEVSFSNYVLGILAVVAFVHRGRFGVRCEAIDLVPIAFVLLTTWSEITNKSMQEGRNLFASQVMGTLAPYWLGRVAAARNGLMVGAVASLVVTGAFIGWAAPYEARMGVDYFDQIWRDRWPGPIPWEGVVRRAGITRVAGPFAHPICHGYFFSIVITLALWLEDRKLLTGFVPRVLTRFGCALGLLLSVSRGPIAGAVIAIVVQRLGWARQRLAIALGGLVLLVIGLGFVADTIRGYVSVSRGEARTETQETAAYRKELLDHYLEAVRERPLLGFGKDQIPVIKGQSSIDNQYLFVALTHGLPASVAFLLLVVAPAAFLTARLARRPSTDPIGRLGWSLVGSLTGTVFTLVTVFSGTQTHQILLLLSGLSVTVAVRLGSAGRTRSTRTVPVP